MKFPCEFQAIKSPRHLDVREQQIDLPPSREIGQGFVSRVCFDYRTAGRPQRFCNCSPNKNLIFDQKYAGCCCSGFGSCIKLTLPLRDERASSKEVSIRGAIIAAACRWRARAWENCRGGDWSLAFEL